MQKSFPRENLNLFSRAFVLFFAQSHIFLEEKKDSSLSHPTFTVIFLYRQSSGREGAGSTKVYSDWTHKESYCQRKATMGLTTLRDYSIMISQNSTIRWISILDTCWKIVGSLPPCFREWSYSRTFKLRKGILNNTTYSHKSVASFPEKIDAVFGQ